MPMTYILHRRFKSTAISGAVNIPACTICKESGGVIYFGNKQICFVTSENAHQFFARDDDGNGLLRGRLTQAIQHTLQKRDPQYQARWDKVWDDKLCRKYKRSEHDDFWLWNHDFFNAPILDLQYIAALVGAKE